MNKNIVIQALEFATHHHKSMFRKGTKIPYMAHLLNVAKLLAERNCSDEVIAASLLHDVVEDCDVTIDEVETKFGKAIATIVAGATEKNKLEKTDHDAAATWHERKQHTINFVKEGASLEQLLVILADKLDNVSSIAYDLKRTGDEAFRISNPFNRK
jgi:(p)ppGpp synthase/HD superfamily hydrolase